MAIAALQKDLATLIHEIRAPQCWRDPYPSYRELRRQGPVLRTADGKLVVAGLRQCRGILSDGHWEHFPELLCMSSQVLDKERKTVPDKPVRPRILDFLPERASLRERLAREFTPRVVRALRCRIQKLADEAADDALRLGAVDLIDAVVIPFTSTVLSEAFGVPPVDRQVFRTWSSTLRRAAEVTFVPGAKAPGVEQASREVGSYVKGLIEERRRRPREDDLLTELVSAPAQGRQWSDDEITSVVVSIIIVGHHTTTAFIGNGIRALVDHPLQFARLRQAAVSAGAAEPPEIAESAVEELLRYDAPAQFVSRYAAQDLDLAGERIEAGQSALLFLGAANRDPTAFDAPESLDLTRKPNDHLAFSLGHAYCFGAPLARLAGQVFFSALARRVSRIAVESDPVPFDTIGLRGLSTLPVRTDAVA